MSVTGSMAVIAPARRDTRSPWLRGREGFGRRVGPVLEAACRVALARCECGVRARLVGKPRVQQLGLTREMSVGAVAAVGVFLWMHTPISAIRRHSPKPSTGSHADAIRGGRASSAMPETRPRLYLDCGETDRLQRDGPARAASRRGRRDRNDGGRTQRRRPRAIQVARRSFRSAAPPDIQLPRSGGAASRPKVTPRATRSVPVTHQPRSRTTSPSQAICSQRRGRAERGGASPAGDPVLLSTQMRKSDVLGHPSLLRRSRPGACAIRNGGPSTKPLSLCCASGSPIRLASALSPLERRNSSSSPLLRWTSSPAPPAGAGAKKA